MFGPVRKYRLGFLLYAGIFITGWILVLAVPKSQLHLAMNQNHSTCQDLFFRTVTWLGSDVQRARDTYYDDMVYIGHLPCIKGDLTTMENIRALLDTRSRSASEKEIEQALGAVGLAGFEDAPSKALSSGQRRRVLLAFLLLSGARLWILDEPLTALDVKGVDLVESMILKHREQGGSVIFTTHHGMQLPCEMSRVDLAKC